MSITLSDSAAARVSSFLANRGKGFGLRLGVRTSGCSGMAYVLEFVDEPASDDTVFEDKGVKVVVDGKSLQFPQRHSAGLRKRRPERRVQIHEPERQRRVWLRRKLPRLTARHPKPHRGFATRGVCSNRLPLRLLWITSLSSDYPLNTRSISRR